MMKEKHKGHKSGGKKESKGEHMSHENPANMRSKPNPSMRPGVGPNMATKMLKGTKKK
jgi:hypothetical protein